MIINTKFWENKDNVLVFSNSKAWKNIKSFPSLIKKDSQSRYMHKVFF